MTRRAARARRAALAALLVALAIVPAATGQVPVLLDIVEELRPDDPETWALQYFTSISVLSGMGTPRRAEAGSVRLALEGGWVPSLSEEQQRVGFSGTKAEDLNRLSAFGRVRADFGLPRGFTLTAALTPPVEVGGVTPLFFDLALARPVFEGRSWRLGLRLHVQRGRSEGDFTCPAALAGVADPAINPDACLEASADEVTHDYAGLELSASPRLGDGRWEPHLALSVNHMEMEFEVRARYSIFVDRTRLRADELSYTLGAGLTYRPQTRWEISGELFWAPLDVVRDPARGVESDDLVNARVLLAYRLR